MTHPYLTAISPIDGRYFKATNELVPYYSEMALIRYRILVEIEYFIALKEIPLPQLEKIETGTYKSLRSIYENFSQEDALKVKNIESVTNHDIKAVEYFIKEKLEIIDLSLYKEFIHFGLTSQDINNTAFPLMIKDAQYNVMLPFLNDIVDVLGHLASLWKDVPMIAYTHGQPASPTTLGKELLVYHERLKQQLICLKNTKYAAKFGGATGNFNAHFVAYPEIDWIDFSNNFVNTKLGLYRTQITTQIEPYDSLAEFCDAYKRINNILVDLCRDIWTYISMDYFKIKIQKGEVGSSAMPHKVNPIDFENAEGNLGVANALFEHLAAKLPISRLQRDLTDSTVLRNIGVPLSHTLIALKSVKRGLNKLSINQEKINNDLEDNWAVLAEAIQTVLRKEFYVEPYEKLKELSRTGKKITQKDLATFIDSLEVDDNLKNYLKKLTPHNYIGMVNRFYK